jgi:heat shock protein HslJ
MRLALLLALALVAGGCRTAAAPDLALAGTSWRLVDLVDNGAALPAAPPDVLTFDTADRGVRVSSCNQCVGLYTVGDRTLEVTRLACTRRACPADRLELDRYVAGRSRWRLDGDRLVLTVNDPLNGIDAVLTFRRAGD